MKRIGADIQQLVENRRTTYSRILEDHPIQPDNQQLKWQLYIGGYGLSAQWFICWACHKYLTGPCTGSTTSSWIWFVPIYVI
ncbi:hypothetical protein PISMIDRAFT_12921 [Pisolithus microcarpus 441]|uniref:Uncharacterized protein n=1 Tax=Pisolithus microcarpus 441 TaxID=765257 RepID=A0A0C9ZKW8_9AGAM|nr:hypothetical protein PISMIDRAFT_12921 [Pisolithus microcarpus 441]